MNNSPINSTINSTTVGELADATSLNEKSNTGACTKNLYGLVFRDIKLKKTIKINKNFERIFSA